MKVTAVKSSTSFGRELRQNEIKEFEQTRDAAKQLTGQTGKSIFIVHDACLPLRKSVDTGLGNLATQDAKDFFKYMKTYLGVNVVEVLPAGELAHSPTGLYCAYSGSAFSLGNHQINPLLLTTNKFGKLLKKSEFQTIVNENHKAAVGDWRANYTNVIVDGSAQDKALKLAYNRFKKLPQSSSMKKEFTEFVNQNNDWLEPKGIYKALVQIHNNFEYKKWNSDLDKNLYNPDYDLSQRTNRINQLLKDNSEDIEFFKFKQYLAESHLKFARKELHSLGLELKGDCEIGYSKDEQWAYPKAFIQDHFIGTADWGLPTLDYDKLNDPNSQVSQVLKKKVQLCARRYDSIRFDVGWAYVNPKIFDAQGNSSTKYLGDDVLTFIENAVKEVKGQDYDLKNLIYEFDGGEVFKNNGELLDPVKHRVKVYGSTFMHENNGDFWGSNDAFLRRGWHPDEFVIGPGNHDPQPLRQIANNVRDLTMEEGNQYHKANAIPPLARILKLDPAALQNPVEFAKAKWAEPMMAKNNEMFYIDVFGREERFDMQGLNLTVHPERNYAYKIPENYRQLYHQAVREGYGFNIMDSLEKVFKAKNYDRTYPELYKRIVKFRNILNEQEIPKSSFFKKNKYFCTAAITISAIGTAVFGWNKFNTKQSPVQPAQVVSKSVG